MGLEKFVKEHKKDLLFLSGLIIFFLVMNIMMTSEMKQLNAPLYGGDRYYQLGCINHIRYGGDDFENCNLLSDNAGYLPFFGIVEAKIANLLGIDNTIEAMIISSNIMIVLAVIFSYLLFRFVSRKPYLAAMGTLLLLFNFRPIFKYTQFAIYIINPLFILAVFLFYKKPNIKRAIFIGITAGLNTITHSVLFPATYFTIAVLFIFLLFDKKFNFKTDKTSFIHNLKKLIPLFLIIAIIAVPLSMLHWGEPIFKHGMQTSPHYLEWNGPGDMSNFGLQINIATGIIKGQFFQFTSSKTVIASILSIFGIIFLIALKKKTDNIKFVTLMLTTLALITFSYFITVPLFNTHFVPNYMFSVFGAAIITCFLLISFNILINLITQISPLKIRKYIFILPLAIIILLLIGQVTAVEKYQEEYKWYEVAKQPLSASHSSMRNFILENTEVNDVFLTSKEVGFALNALTGRKLLVGRRAQNDAFENLDEREMTSAIILYGKDTEIKKKLIEKYNIKYLYWEPYWIQSEYYFDNKGQIAGWFDPLIAFDNNDYRKILEKNNVKFSIKNTHVDPSLKSEYHPTFDLIFITPDNYHNATHPWNPNLDEFLEEIWTHTQNGQKSAIIYKIKINKNEE